MSSFGRIIASRTLYIVVLSAIASASDSTATTANPGCRTNDRAARRTSWLERRMITYDDLEFHEHHARRGTEAAPQIERLAVVRRPEKDRVSVQRTAVVDRRREK